MKCKNFKYYPNTQGTFTNKRKIALAGVAQWTEC